MKRKFILALCTLGMFTLSGGYHVVMAQADAAEETALEDETTGADEKSEEEQAKEDTEKDVLEDGVYTAEFDTDSTMFHVNEAYDGKGTLTVEDGEMTIHVSLVSKSIVNLFPWNRERRTERWRRASETYHRQRDLQRWIYGRGLRLRYSYTGA